MDKLSREEVLHVANLGRLELTEEEIIEYSYKLKDLLNEIEKINDIEVETEEILISPVSDQCKLNKDKAYKMIDKSLVIKNAPHVENDFIAVKGVFDE